MLTREPESRRTQHIRISIPREIKGLTENDRKIGTPSTHRSKDQQRMTARLEPRVRKKQTWERDSIARATYNQENIPDCNVKATVGKHFLCHEPIPRSENGQGYLRVTRSSLWWQQRVSQCMDGRGTLDMRGKRIQMVCKQHYLQSPQGDVARILSGPAASECMKRLNTRTTLMHAVL
jgi:hypothetical protein